jgi:hypothetical protein
VRRGAFLLVVVLLAALVPGSGTAAAAPTIVGSASTPSGRGRWDVSSRGGVFTSGDARFFGSLGNLTLNQPISGIAARPQGDGYWLVARDGGVFTFGAARFHGSLGARPPTSPVTSIAAGPTGNGYRLRTADGRTFAFGEAPAAPTCTVFPADNPWNADVSASPVHPRSAAWVGSIGSGGRLHPDVGTVYGIPYVEVGAGQARVPVTFEYADESDPGPYPIPPSAPVEGGGDRHVLVVDRESCRLWELFAASTGDGGRSWRAGSGATWDLRSNAVRPDGWTSADAAGLPIFPGLIRYDEVAAGRIDHALRFTISRTQRAHLFPARHHASSITDPNVAPMGARFRLKASFDCSPLRHPARVVCVALKRYGMFVADNGSNWYLTGAPDPRWDDDALQDLGHIPGGAFEAVQT